jgi:hypothetical protein
VIILDQVRIHSAGGRIVVIVLVVLMTALVVFVAWKSMGALRHLPRKELSSRQRAIVAAFVGSEVLATALGILVGYLTAGTGEKASGSIVGGLAGAFIWLATCWVVGGIVRAQRPHQAPGSSTAT